MITLLARGRRRLDRVRTDDSGIALVLVLLVGTLTMMMLATMTVTLINTIGTTRNSLDRAAVYAAAEAGLEDFVATVNTNCLSTHGFTCSWLVTGRASSSTVSDPTRDAGTPVCPPTDTVHCSATVRQRFYWKVTTQVSGSARVISVGQVPTGKASPKFRTTTLVADVQASPSFSNFEYYTKYETLPPDFLNQFYGPRDVELTAGSDRSNSTLSGTSGAGTLHWNGTCTYVDATTTPPCDPNHDTSICNDLYYPTSDGPGRGTDSAWNNTLRRPDLATRQAMGTDDTTASGRSFAYYSESGSFTPTSGLPTAVTHNDVCDTTFEPNMVMSGPIFSKDAYLIDRGKDTGNSANSMPIFNDYAYTAWTGSLNGAQQPVGPNGGQDRAYPNTDGQISTPLSNQPVYTSNPFELPPNANASRTFTTCTYTGPTRISINQGVASVTSPLTPTSPTPAGPSYCYASTGSFTATGGGGVVNAQVPISSTVIYVQKPTSGSVVAASATSPIFDLRTRMTLPGTTSGGVLTGAWTDNATYSATATCPSPADPTKRRNFDCEASTAKVNLLAALQAASDGVVGGATADASVQAALLTALKAKIDKTGVLVTSQPSSLTKGDVRYLVNVGALTAGTATTTKPAAQSDAFFQSTPGQGYTTTPKSWAVTITRYGCTQSATCASNKQDVKALVTGSATRSVSAANSPLDSTSRFPWAGAQTGTTTYTDANNDITHYDTNSADAYVEGTLRGQMTIVAEHDIVVTNDLLYSSSANLTTTSDGLALVANHNVRVYRPMTCTDDGTAGSTTTGYCPNDLSGAYSQPQSFPLPNNFPSAKYTPDAAPSMTHGGTGKIYATIFTLRGCFMMDNFYRGTVGQGITVYGGLYQDHRGPTSLPYQGRPYQGSQNKMPGVLLNYVYDNMRAGQTANGGLRVPWIPNPSGRPAGSTRTWNITSISTGS